MLGEVVHAPQRLGPEPTSQWVRVDLGVGRGEVIGALELPPRGHIADHDRLLAAGTTTHSPILARAHPPPSMPPWKKQNASSQNHSSGVSSPTHIEFGSSSQVNPARRGQRPPRKRQPRE